MNLNRIIEIINKTKSGVIVIPENPSIDAVAASTAFYLSLVKIGKSITLACSDKITYDLTASDKFKNTITAEGNSLMISFPYVDGSIDKIDYNIQGNFFNLIINPRPGYQKLNPDQVTYSYTGGIIDFIVVIDSPTLNSLGKIYQENQSQFTGKDIINIDRHLTNTYFGTANFVDKTTSSISELILKIIRDLKIEIDKDIATNLYAGIAASTNNFTSYSTNANTFENVAFLLRSGAIKKNIRKTEPQKNPSYFNQPTYASEPIKHPYPPSSEIQQQPFMPTPIEKIELEKQPSQSNFEQNQSQNQNPSEMLKPKIFRGGGLI